MIHLNADFYDKASYHPLTSDDHPAGKYVDIILRPEEKAAYTYRFYGEKRKLANRLGTIDMPEGFTVIAPDDAHYDETKKDVVRGDESVSGEWIVFGFPDYAKGYKDIRGDVNGDGKVDVADIGAVIDFMASTTPDALVSDSADVNDDKAVDVADIGDIIDIMAGKGDDDPMGKASEGIEP